VSGINWMIIVILVIGPPSKLQLNIHFYTV
jgi:hypothetical protein